jgi:site-specific recombinase XerD
LTKLEARVAVRGLFVRWRDTELTNRKDVKEVSRMFEKDVLPVLGNLFVEDVRKGHITQVTDALLMRGVKRMAKMILGLIRQMFRFAVDRGIIEFDPTASIRKAKICGKDVEPIEF